MVVDEGRVVIEPPYHIDRVYDDLWLHVKGNMLEEQKLEIAQRIASLLNAELVR